MDSITVFIVLKRSGECIMMLEGSVVQDLSLIQSRKTCRISHLWIFCYTRERWFKNIVTNWHSTDDKMVTNNHTTISMIIIMITIVKVLIFFGGWLKNHTIGLSSRSNNDYTMLLFILLVNYNFFLIPLQFYLCKTFVHTTRHSAHLPFHQSIILPF